jgi:REP element-mobilizing transposase RayT
MARGKRIDAPGMLHHVTFRGVDGCPIFKDDPDRWNLIGRADRLLIQLGFLCFAWVFMLNHAHFILQTGAVPLPRLMAQLGTGYALYFNRRHNRKGHLWQGRYWSRPLEADVETAAAYVHANPSRAGLVPDESPEQYFWCGHAGAAGARARFPFEELALRALRPSAVASEASAETPRESFDALLARVCERAHLSAADVTGTGRSREVTRARAEIAALAVREHRYRAAEVARALGLDDSSVSRLLARTRR